jgi:hypothetical protein
MITEDYISFETAKLMKEKGFDVYVRSFYEKDKYRTKEEFSTNNALWNYNISSFRYSAPTLQMAIKWLRETFEIHCQVDCPIGASNWLYGIRDLNEDEWLTLRDMGDYDSYEEACEAAIKYCLENLI